MMTLSRPGFVAATALVVLGVLPQPGLAQAAQVQQQVLTVPGAQFAGYATPVVVVEKGGKLSYTNLDIVQHDVVHDPAADGVSGPNKKPWCRSFPKGACPVFWSKRAGLSESVVVKGLRSVKRGRNYTFYCTLHHSMRGRLVVLP
jgi:plastocyanin